MCEVTFAILGKLPPNSCQSITKNTNNDVMFFVFFPRVVEFASYSDLKNALEKLSGKEINGRKIKLIEAAKKR